MMRGGIPGAIGAWFGFTLPSGVIMILAGYGRQWAGNQDGLSKKPRSSLDSIRRDSVLGDCALDPGDRWLRRRHPHAVNLCHHGSTPDRIGLETNAFPLSALRLLLRRRCHEPDQSCAVAMALRTIRCWRNTRDRRLFFDPSSGPDNRRPLGSIHCLLDRQ